LKLLVAKFGLFSFGGPGKRRPSDGVNQTGVSLSDFTDYETLIAGLVSISSSFYVRAAFAPVDPKSAKRY